MVEVKLVGNRTSLFFVRVEWALKLKGINYDKIHEDVRNKSDLLLKLNPVHKKIPVFVHGDKVLAESLVILEYIEDTWKANPLLPRDPYDKALARFWAKFNDDKCIPGAWYACRLEGEDQAKAIESAKETFAFLEKEVQGKKFFGGESAGFLDLVVGWIPLCVGTLEEVGGFKLLDEESFPSLHEWMENFKQVPGIKECMPEREDMVNYVKHFQGGNSNVRSLAAAKK